MGCKQLDRRIVKNITTSCEQLDDELGTTCRRVANALTMTWEQLSHRAVLATWKFQRPPTEPFVLLSTILITCPVFFCISSSKEILSSYSGIVECVRRSWDALVTVEAEAHGAPRFYMYVPVTGTFCVWNIVLCLEGS